MVAFNVGVLCASVCTEALKANLIIVPTVSSLIFMLIAIFCKTVAVHVRVSCMLVVFIFMNCSRGRDCSLIVYLTSLVDYCIQHCIKLNLCLLKTSLCLNKSNYCSP